jgi:hypothetical protein
MPDRHAAVLDRDEWLRRFPAHLLTRHPDVMPDMLARNSGKETYENLIEEYPHHQAGAVHYDAGGHEVPASP